MGTVTSKLVVSLKDDVSGPAKKVSDALRNAGKQVDALSKAGFSNRLSSQLSKLGLQARDIDKVSAAWRTYASAQGLAGRSGDWTRSQISQVRSWESATIASLRHVTRERQRFAAQQARSTVRSEATHGVLGGVAAAVTGYRVKEIAKKAVISAAEFDIGVRKQREFVDIPKDIQDRVLTPQAKKIGQDTQFSNLDVVKAQTKAMQGLPASFDAKLRAEVGAGILESVKNYALVMEADLEQSSEGIRTFLQTTNKDISTKEKAIAQATRATNLLVKMAKLGGMNDEDVQQYMKFGAATATAAGLSDTTVAALGSVGRRGGLRGDQLGVFLRAISSKLVAPTYDGLDALTAAGIDYNKFTKMPGGLSVNNLNAFAKRRFGTSLNESQVGRLDEILDDPEVVSSREEFTKQVSAVISESFGKTKKGKTKAADAKKIAKMVGAFHKLSVESVDTEGLLNEIMTNPKMTIALLNAMFTDKHGGKGSIIASKWGEFTENKAALDKVSEDPDFAKRKADEIMGGLGGSFERLKGSVENLTLAMGQAHEGWLKPAMEKTGNAMDWVSNLKPGELASASGTAIAAGVTGGLALVRQIPWVSAVIGAGSATAAVASTAAIAGYGAYSLAEGANERAGITRESTRERVRRQAAKYDFGTGRYSSFFGKYVGDQSAGGDQGPSIAAPQSVHFSTPQDNTTFTTGTSAVQGLDMSGQAAAAGSKSGSAFKQGIISELNEVDALIRAKVQSWASMLSFSASPSITPKLGVPGPAPKADPRQGAADTLKQNRHAAFADGLNFGSFA